jgi:hypothetical protein
MHTDLLVTIGQWILAMEQWLLQLTKHSYSQSCSILWLIASSHLASPFCRSSLIASSYGHDTL